MTTDKLTSALRQIQALVNEALCEVPSKRPEKPARQKARQDGSAGPISFDMNVLAFMNKHAKRLSGPKKFTLLLAWMAKGSPSVQVQTKDIRTRWNKMTSVLAGDFNPAHGNRAKTAGWVDSEKGRWKLTAAWKDALA